MPGLNSCILYMMKTFFVSTGTDPLILTHGERDVLLLGRAAKSPADHPTAPPENPLTPYRRLFLHSLSPCTEKSPFYIPSSCDCWLLGPSLSSPYPSSWRPPRSFLVGRYRHPTTSTLPTTVSYRVLEQSHLLRGLTPPLCSRETHSILYRVRAIVDAVS